MPPKRPVSDLTPRQAHLPWCPSWSHHLPSAKRVVNLSAPTVLSTAVLLFETHESPSPPSPHRRSTDGPPPCEFLLHTSHPGRCGFRRTCTATQERPTPPERKTTHRRNNFFFNKRINPAFCLRNCWAPSVCTIHRAAPLPAPARRYPVAQHRPTGLLITLKLSSSRLRLHAPPLRSSPMLPDSAPRTCPAPVRTLLSGRFDKLASSETNGASSRTTSGGFSLQAWCQFFQPYWVWKTRKVC